MANLSVEDLFYLFNQACLTTGNPGYTGKLSQQTAKTQASWTEFHRELMQYVSQTNGKPSPTATKVDAVRAIEDAISADVKKYEFKDQKIMYRMLYNIGHRINL